MDEKSFSTEERYVIGGSSNESAPPQRTSATGNKSIAVAIVVGNGLIAIALGLGLGLGLNCSNGVAPTQPTTTAATTQSTTPLTLPTTTTTKPEPTTAATTTTTSVTPTTPITTITVPPPSTTQQPTTQPPAEEKLKSAGETYRYATVTTDNEICSTVGVDIMARKGGSAVDAGLASLICLGLIQSQSSGIGGGHSMTIYEKPVGGTEKEWRSLVARETAPTWAHKDMFRGRPSDDQSRGGTSIMVPGELNGIYEAWKRYGRVAWQDLFQPTIDLATNGWPVSSHMDLCIGKYPVTIRNEPGLKSHYHKPDGTAYVYGENITDLTFAATLEKIANDPDHIKEFYEGDLAKDIVDDIAAVGGNITLEDMRNNSVQWNDPIIVPLGGGYQMYGTYLPTSSILMGFMMKIMEGYNMTSDDIKDHKGKALFLHRFVEAHKMAYTRRRRFVGDPDFIDDDLVNKWISDLTDDAYVKSVRDKINDDYILSSSGYEPDTGQFAGADGEEKAGGTVHLNVLSPEGSWVGITSTVGLYFGAKVRGIKTGMIFNDLLNLFDTPATMDNEPDNTVNQIGAGKRGRTSTGCQIIVDPEGNPVIAAGGSGGTRIRTSTTQVMVQSLWMGMNMTESIDEPRVYATSGAPDRLYHDAMPQEILDELASKGFGRQEETGDTYDYLAVVQGIDVTQCRSGRRECIEGVSDYRKDGRPDGF